MGQQRGTKFGYFSSCWRKKKLRHHDGVGREDVSQQRRRLRRERHRKAEDDDNWFLVDDVGKEQRMIEVDEKIQQQRGDL